MTQLGRSDRNIAKIGPRRVALLQTGVQRRRPDCVGVGRRRRDTYTTRVQYVGNKSHMAPYVNVDNFFVRCS